MKMTLPHVARVLLAAVTLAAGGCGVGTIYNNADRLAMRAVDDLVSLEPDQRDQVEARLEYRLDWHCASQMPRYADLLEELAADLEAGYADRETLGGYVDRVFGFWSDLQARMPEDAAVLLAGLDEHQAGELLDGLDERTRQARQELEEATLQGLAEERARGARRPLRRFYGRLNADQRDRLEAWSHALVPTAAMRLERREAWLEDFAVVLENRNDPRALEAGMNGLLAPAGTDWPPAFRAAMEANREATVALLADLYELASPRQRARLTGRVDSLAGDVRSLTCSEPTEG